MSKLKMALRWTISWHPHADGTDRGNPRDAGASHACQSPAYVNKAPMKY